MVVEDQVHPRRIGRRRYDSNVERQRVGDLHVGGGHLVPVVDLEGVKTKVGLARTCKIPAQADDIIAISFACTSFLPGFVVRREKNRPIAGRSGERSCSNHKQN